MDTRKADLVKSAPSHVRHHLNALQQSGKTVAAYCRQAGISPWSIYDWKRRYGSPTSAPVYPPVPKEVSPVSFTALGTLKMARPTARFDIRFSGGTSIRVYNGATVEELAPFIALVRNRSASC